MNELEKRLIYMRDRAKRNVKKYKDIPAVIMEYEDYLFTYAIEESLVGLQRVLTISKTNKESFAMPTENFSLINKVFGEFPVTFIRSYPMRGYCIQLVGKD